MKTCFSIVTIIVVMTAFAWGQNAAGDSDARALEREMDIMNGILDTVLASHIQDLRDKSGNSIAVYNRDGNVLAFSSSSLAIRSNSASVSDSFYLPGQGAVFMIPTVGMRNTPLIINSGSIFGLSLNEVRASISKLEAGIHEPGARHEDMVDAREQINKLQNDNRRLFEAERQNQTAGNDQAFRQALDGLKELLVDTLARYGDSLSVVKPDEYVNLVLHAPVLALSASREQNVGRNVGIISARKSWITDYRAGRMTLDEFRKKVIHQR